MRMKTQLLFSQLPTVFIILFMTIFFISVLTLIQQKSENVLSKNYKSITALQRFNELLEKISISDEDRNIQNSQENSSKLKILKNKAEQYLIIQEKNSSESVEEADLTRILRQRWEMYKKNLQTPSPKTVPNNSLYINTIQREIKALSSNIIELNLDNLIRSKEGLSQSISNYRNVITFGCLVCLIFGFFMTWFFTELFLTPLRKMTEIMKQVGKEEKRIILHIKGAEEIEELSKEFNLMTSRLEAYHKSTLGHVSKDYQILKVIFDALPDPILLLNNNNEVIYTNQAALELQGIKGTSKEIGSFFHLEYNLKDTLIKIAQKIRVTRTSYLPEKAEKTICLFKKNKKILFFPWAYPIRKPLTQEPQTFAGIVIILQDIMRLPLSEIGKINIYETLIHEFRSPLTEMHMAIHTCVQEAAGPLTEKQQEILYGARQKCEELERLCQDLLNLSQINQERQVLEIEEIDIREVLSHLMTSFQLETYQKGLFIEVEEPTFLSKIKGNANQLEILISNLLRNAIHYADPGTTITIRLHEQGNIIMLSLNNKGPLILPEYRQKIFKNSLKSQATGRKTPA